MAYPTNRVPSGKAGGAAGGRYPNTSGGLPHTNGLAITDDFIRPVSGTTYGDLGWPIQTIGTAPTVANQTPTGATEIGITRVTTSGGNVLEGGGLAFPGASFLAAPPEGSIWCAKVRLVDTTQIEVWSGFVETPTTRVATGVTNGFLGLRAVAAGAGVNWFGVARIGITETTVDLGISADTTWRMLGFERLNSGNVQFFELSSLERHWDRTDVGAEIATNVPTANLTPIALAVVQVTAANRSAEIDLWDLGGDIAR